MGQFIATIDPSGERRTQFARQAQRELESFYGSSAQIVEQGDLALVSWAEPWEPSHRAQSAAGVAFVWGHAAERGQSFVTPPDLARLWGEVPDRMPVQLEGFHSALFYHSDGSWTAGADFSGIVPLYYFQGKDYVVIGSSPELFRAHPKFRATLDPAGLAGILLTNGLVGGRSLLQGVQRLGSGNLLHAQPGQTLREIRQYRPETSDCHFGASFEENYRRMRDVLDDCFRRHMKLGGAYGLLLSGGLDSRLMAALMKRGGADFTALTFGDPGDIEMQCALAVAGELQLRHRTVPIRTDHYVNYAESECKWKHLANGFNSLMFHEPIVDAGEMRGGLLSGFHMEGILGYSHASWAGDDPKFMSFEKMFRRVNRWGMPVKLVKRLLAKNFDTAVVDQVLRQTKEIYNGYSVREFQRAWLFDLHHRSRYHTSIILGLHSRWPWPVAPYFDTAMMELMGGMPYAHVRDRRMQVHMLKEEFTNLARIPLDRNSFHKKPLLPRFGRQADRVLYKIREMYDRGLQSFRERRFYYRTMNFDNVGWNAVREAAETSRAKAAQIFDESALAEALPRPGVHAVVADAIIDSSKMKCMAGLLLWLRSYA